MTRPMLLWMQYYELQYFFKKKNIGSFSCCVSISFPSCYGISQLKGETSCGVAYDIQAEKDHMGCII